MALELLIFCAALPGVTEGSGNGIALLYSIRPGKCRGHRTG